MKTRFVETEDEREVKEDGYFRGDSSFRDVYKRQVVDYPTMTTDDVWNYIGGWLNDSYVSGDAKYINNCASVSYTHLDVYKRQHQHSAGGSCCQ